MYICLFDPSYADNAGVPSNNLGDVIIQRAVMRELRAMAKDIPIVHVSTHAPMSSRERGLARRADLAVVGGSNLLSSRMRPYNIWNKKTKRWSNQWAIDIRNALSIRSAILLGVGWQQYQPSADILSKIMLRAALSRSALHSVRDGFTKARLQQAGLPNVTNTSCVVMWPLAANGVERIPTTKAANALVALTDYAQNPEADGRLLDICLARYERVTVWPQGRGDRAYVRSLGRPVACMSHSYAEFEQVLRSDLEFDYIGTRLHAGLACLTAGRRSLIIRIDNRAREIARDTGLFTLDRYSFDSMERWIAGSDSVQLTLPTDEISRWRDEFMRALHDARTDRCRRN